jgi:peptidoglycan hydrolase-like protein with peptidoglycan-binding domain
MNFYRRIGLTLMAVVVFFSGATFATGQTYDTNLFITTDNTTDVATRLQAVRAQLQVLLEQLQRQSSDTSNVQIYPAGWVQNLNTENFVPLTNINTSENARARLCRAISRSLTIGSRGGDVTELQNFLREEGFLNVDSTGYYGPLTQAALQRFQSSVNIVSSGSPVTTGWGVFGPLTRRFMLRMCGESNDANFTATPRSGVPPLNVSFSAMVGATTTQRYSVDFGDGSSMGNIACTAQGNTCTAAGTVNHTYATIGTYTATLYRVDINAGTNGAIVRYPLSRQTIVVSNNSTVSNDTTTTTTGTSCVVPNNGGPQSGQTVDNGTVIVSNPVSGTVLSLCSRCENGQWVSLGVCNSPIDIAY